MRSRLASKIKMSMLPPLTQQQEEDENEDEETGEDRRFRMDYPALHTAARTNVGAEDEEGDACRGTDKIRRRRFLAAVKGWLQAKNPGRRVQREPGGGVLQRGAGYGR